MTSKEAHLILVEELIQPKLDPKLRDKILSDLISAWLKQQLEEAEMVLLRFQDSVAGQTPLMGVEVATTKH